MSTNMNKPFKKSKGFTLLEVLIAVLVLSIGLLGLAALQASSMRSNFSAFSLGQAVILTNDIADRIRNNPAGVAGGFYDSITGPAGVQDCEAGACSPTQLATHDTTVWFNNIATMLPAGSTATVAGNGAVAGAGAVFTITVMWDDARTGVNGTGCSGDPTVDMFCLTTMFIP